MALRKIVAEKRKEILRISKEHGASNVRIFGSVVRGEERADSDVDFLVDLEKDRSLLDLGGLSIELQQLLGRHVDVVTEKGLHWFIRDKVIKEAQPL
jgi:predicted nucleotidyltransferase